MEEQVDLSLSIVTYNNEAIIEKTVKNIIESMPKEKKYKLYIIDNNSSDDTLDIVKNIKGEIEIFELDVNNGFGFGHNKVLRQLNSKYHLVVNPDITIENNEQITNMLNYMDDNLEIGMLSPLIVNSDLSIQYLCKTNPTVFDMLIRRLSPNFFPNRQQKYVLKNTGYDKIMKIDYASGCFMFFRTRVFLKLQGFDENFFMYLEDADITRRVNEISKAIFFPKARVIHAWGRGGHKNIRFAFITVKSMVIYFKKWGLKLL